LTQGVSRILRRRHAPDWLVGVRNRSVLSSTNIAGATWKIRQGISENNGGTIIACGMTAARNVTTSDRDGFRIHRANGRSERTGRLPAGGDYFLNVALPRRLQPRESITETRVISTLRCPGWNAAREMVARFCITFAFTFSEDVTSISNASTTTCGKVTSTTVGGNTVTVQLGHVNCDGPDITVNVAGVNGASGFVDASATITLQVADVNSDGVVGTEDINEIRHIGRGLVHDGNFRDDITVDGHINHGDKTLAKTKL
jgi:hypothetical protein